MHIAQLIAAHAVADVMAGHNLTVSFPKALAKAKQATPQQQAAAQDYSYLTCRFYLEAAATLATLTPKPVSDTRVEALLCVAISQLLHSDADDFTVVNQAVNAAGMLRLSWAKGLVNAVLRNFLRQRETIQTTIAQREEVRFNYPRWWVDMVRAQYPEHWSAILDQGNQHPPFTLRVNQRLIAIDQYIDTLNTANIPVQALGGGAVQILKPMPVHGLPGFSQGWVSVQDLAAQWAASLLDVSPGMRVLDACSAPGGKAGHLLETTSHALTALDIDASRLQRVQDNLTRLGLQAHLQLGDAADADWFDGVPYDRILADVPCSASGIVRRHVDMKWLRRPQDIAQFARQQQQILANLWQMLAKNGKLLYVTCSIFQQENEMQIQQFLAQHADAQRLPIDFSMANMGQAHAIGGQLIPSPTHDGLFYACLQKV